MSFRIKTILGIMAIQFALLLFIIWNALIFQSNSIKKEFVNRATTTIGLFATTTKDAVISYDLATLENFISEALKNPGLVYTRVRDSSGRVLAENGNILALERRFEPDSSLERVNDNVYNVYKYVEEGGHIYGKVEIGISTAPLKLAYFDALKKLMFIAGVELLLSGLLSFLLGSFLARQLESLKQASEKISAGEFGCRIQVRGRDEIASAAIAFNQMSQNINEYQEQIQCQNTELEQQNKCLENEIVRRQEAEINLRQANENLEAKVTERTAELKNRTVELEQKHQELKETQMRLIQAGKMSAVGQLAAGVSHELNNPLGGIMGYSEFILEKAAKKGAENIPPEELKKILSYVKLINDASIRCKTIVANLLKFSRETNQNTFMQIEINNVIVDTLSLMHHQLEINNIATVENLTTDLPPVAGNPSQLQQVFTNIIINAQQAMKDGGQLIITTKTLDVADRAVLEISFQDTGCGILSENLDKLFEPFFTTRDPNEGQGLGLAVCYGIIKDHGGEIKVESKPNEGSIFIVQLPVK